MRAVSREVGIWSPPGQRPAAGLLSLAAGAGALGGREALAQWQAAHPEASVAYAHGQRHDLWWEFHLAASFKWQAHIHRLNPEYCRQRILRLTRLFDLAPLLGRRVEELTPAERVRANVAVALLAQPDVLVWEEPFRSMPGREWMQLCRTVRRLCRTDGLTVILIAAIKEETSHDRHFESWVDDLRDGGRARPAGRRAAAAGSGGR
ncbi:MAG TPA: hypothetical protein VNT75_22325 [Symbiobacteriaceae bacterium]|nr:hypothetical protein [Symbiobacteriaceae bacterium]